MIWNLRCTITIGSVLANSKTQNSFLFTVNAIFRHDYPLAVEPASTPRPLVQKKLGEILCLLICFFLPCLSWLLRSQVQKSRRDLWITLYIKAHIVFTEITSCCTVNSMKVVVNWKFLGRRGGETPKILPWLCPAGKGIILNLNSNTK